MIDADIHDGLALSPDGRPTRALRRVDLDGWHDASPPEIARAASAAASSLELTIGLATKPLPIRLQPLIESLTVTVAGPAVDAACPAVVRVPEPQHAFAVVAEAAARSPRASVAMGQLLRQTPALSTVPGLAAEAAVYSMLLGGPEFARWLAGRGPARSAEASEGDLVRIDRDDQRLSVVLNQPRRRNAFSFRMREELFEALSFAEIDDSVERVDISGAGPAFCSGGDLAEFGTAKDLVTAYLVRLDRAPWRVIDRLRDRVSIDIHGAAVGAGIEMAAFAGRVVASSDAFFLLPELEMGLVPGAGGTVSVTRRIGRWRTAWMVLSGTRVDAATAAEWGLVDELRPT